MDPMALTEQVKGIVGSGEKRKYYRFRPAPYYGADCDRGLCGLLFKVSILLVLEDHQST